MLNIPNKGYSKMTAFSTTSQNPHRELARNVSSLEPNSLMSLIRGEILALRIPNFYPQTLCQKSAQRLLKDPRFGYYTNEGAGNVGRISMAYCETLNNPHLTQQYYAQSLPDIRRSREIFSPYLSPIDRLRLELQELWPFGANLENLEGKTMNVGVIRVFERGSEALPHQDILRRDATSFPRAYELQTQLAANIYLQTAEGGELEIWQRKVSDREYEQVRSPNSYGVRRDILGMPEIAIEPDVGDLILFDSNHIHAVASIQAGVRITMSCFVGYRGKNQPLSQWS
jgi:hypothetical protein